MAPGTKIEIKICGLKTPETLAAALRGGASHVGFIFFGPGPRNVAPAEAARLREAARGRAEAVAVTVDADDVALAEIVETVRPDLLQLHGNETAARVAAVKSRFGLPVVKAFSLREAADLEAVRPYEGVADRFLFDAKPPKNAKLPGGNGVSFDWTLLGRFRSETPWFLSGGLHPGNVAQALRVARPPAIDVSSGVELVPGRKDIGLINTFLRAARAAAAAQSPALAAT